MFDTIWITSNLGAGKLGTKAEISALMKKLNPNYKIESRPYLRDAEARKKNIKYRCQFSITPIIQTKKNASIRLKLLPLLGFEHLSTIKIEAEISKFRSLSYFIKELCGLFDHPAWGEVVKKHILTRCDLKFDMVGMRFHELKDSLDYSYARNPCIKTNCDNRFNTLYLSKNHYFYEKGEGIIREERRIFTKKEISKRLKVKNLFELTSIEFSDFQSLFLHKKFYQVEPGMQTLIPETDQHLFSRFLNHLNNKEYTVEVTRKGKKFFKTFDCFVCAKQKCNSESKRRFSKRIVPLFKELDFDYHAQLENAFVAYFTALPSDYMPKEWTTTSSKNKNVPEGQSHNITTHNSTYSLKLKGSKLDMNNERGSVQDWFKRKLLYSKRQGFN